MDAIAAIDPVYRRPWLAIDKSEELRLSKIENLIKVLKILCSYLISTTTIESAVPSSHGNAPSQDFVSCDYFEKQWHCWEFQLMGSKPVWVLKNSIMSKNLIRNLEILKMESTTKAAASLQG